MTAISHTTRPFRVGTLGWSAGDLDDPAIERRWLDGRYEIINGVLTEMAAAYFYHGDCVQELIRVLWNHFDAIGLHGRWSTEVDIVVDDLRVVRADAVFMSRDDRRRQHLAAQQKGRRDLLHSRLYVPPTLVIESVSAEHESHDRVTKRNWYAEFGVPNYWIIDGSRRTLECLSLDEGRYRSDAAGSGSEILKAAAFGGVTIKLSGLWED